MRNMEVNFKSNSSQSCRNVDSSTSWIKSKNMKLVFASCPLSTRH